jgi:hypothetical protein
MHFTSYRVCRAAFPLALGALLLGGVLVIEPLASRAALLQDADTTAYTLQRIFKVNNTDHYKATMKLKVNGPATGGQEIEVAISAKMKETTKEIKANGHAVIVLELSGAHLKAGDIFDQEIPDDQMPKVIQTMDKAGRVLEAEVDGGAGPFAGNGGVVQGLSRFQSSFYPTRPVKIGDSWDIESKMPADANGVQMVTKGKATLTEKEMLQGVETLKIKVTTETKQVDKNMEKTVLKFEGTGNLNPKTGILARMAGRMEGVIGPAGDTKADLTIEQIPADARAEAEKKAP